MKKIFLSIFILLLINFQSEAQNLSPYVKVGESSDTMQQTYDKVITALKNNSFTVLGAYNPSGKSSLKVIAFTNTQIKNTVVKVKDRGALAATFKVGLVKKGDKITISYTNPDYILRAYLGSNYDSYKSIFNQYSLDLKKAFANLGNEFTPFGGQVKASKLKKYHYMMAMPYFDDPVALKTFASFEEGLTIIKNNLKTGRGNTKLVYKLVYKSNKIAVFGIGLNNKKNGEAHFLPIVGETHVAAMPYEIILQGKEATMLHGKYRIALHWPELTMGTFMKIMSTPGDIEDAFKSVCE